MEKRIMLIGEMGNGKSATGNSIIGKSFFRTGSSLKSVTKRYCRYQGPSENLPVDQDLVIIDTPGYFSTDSSFKHRALEIQRYIIENPLNPPHAFLLVFSLARQDSSHDCDTIDMFHILFGELVFKHCIVVFTRADAIKTDEEFERYWRTNDVLREVVEKCGGRVTRIENRFNDDFEDENVDERIGLLIGEIDSLSQSGKYSYKYPDIPLHNIFLENLQDADNKTVAQVVREFDAFLSKTKTMKILKYTGLLFGIGFIAVCGTKVIVHYTSKGAELVKNKIGETAAAAAKHFVEHNLSDIVQPLLPNPEQISETATAAARSYMDRNLPNIGQQIAQQVEARRNRGGCLVM